MSGTVLRKYTNRVTSLLLAVLVVAGATSGQFFKTELDKMSAQCKDQVTTCSETQSSDFAHAFFKVGEFCAILQKPSGVYTCLVVPNGCTDDEFNQLNAASCKNVSSFIKKIIDTPALCQDAIGTCFKSADDIKALMVKREYCQVMDFKDEDEDTHNCLVKNPPNSNYKCTQDDYDALKAAACPGSSANTMVFTVSTGLLCALIHVVSLVQKL